MPKTTWLAVAGLLAWLGYEIVLRRLAVVLVTVLGLLGVGRVPVGARWVGAAIMALGLGVRAWGMAVLGRFYIRTLRVVGAYARRIRSLPLHPARRSAEVRTPLGGLGGFRATSFG